MQYIATSKIINDILVQKGSGKAIDACEFPEPFDDKLNLFWGTSKQVQCKTFLQQIKFSTIAYSLIVHYIHYIYNN